VVLRPSAKEKKSGTVWRECLRRLHALHQALSEWVSSRHRRDGRAALIWHLPYPLRPVCSRIRELRETLSAGTIALEISRRNARVQALQDRWDRLRAGVDWVLKQRGADMADLPGGASGLLCRDYKGKEADRVVTRVDSGLVSLLSKLRAHEQQAVQELSQWRLSRINTAARQHRRFDSIPGQHFLKRVN
jgi:hypothetical protein